MSAAGDGHVDERDRAGVGDFRQLVSLGRSRAARLQVDRVLGPIVERLHHLEHDLRGWEHRDYNASAAYDLTWPGVLLRPRRVGRSGMRGMTSHTLRS